MNARGEVVDAKLVEAGYGQEIKGINDYEGEITGKPAPGSKFTKLKIGMSLKQVTDIAASPRIRVRTSPARRSSRSTLALTATATRRFTKAWGG